MIFLMGYHAAQPYNDKFIFIGNLKFSVAILKQRERLLQSQRKPHYSEKVLKQSKKQHTLIILKKFKTINNETHIL